MIDYYKSIKNELINDEIYSSVKDLSKERHRVITYYNVGKLLSDAGKHYGKDIVGEYSRKLVVEVNKKYNKSTLYRMKKLYNLLSNEKVAPLVPLLNWTQLLLLIPMKDLNKINYYIMQVKNRNLSKRGLEEIIKNKEYERLPNKTKEKLANNELIKIEDNIKDPIIIKNNINDAKDISEKFLQRLIIENIENFMNELGCGYTFVGSEYPIKIGEICNYIDILLFNTDFNCYTVIELKVTELKKEHIGQIEVYMNYIDKHVKNIFHNNTMGLIIVKKNNKLYLEYSSDSRIITREFIIIN